MNQFILLIVGILALTMGSILGYYARQSIARKQVGTIEARIQRKIIKTKDEAQTILDEARGKASRFLEKTKKDFEERQKVLLRTEQLSLKREASLSNKFDLLEEKERDFEERVKKL